VQGQLGGDLGVQLGQELCELHRPVPAVERGDDGSVGDVERGEQAGHAVADVVVGSPLGPAGHHGQYRLAAGQRLGLAPFVHAQHDRALRRVEVEPDHVVDLLHEQRIGRQLERLGAMRLPISSISGEGH
jgi:hypothetical protein